MQIDLKRRSALVIGPKDAVTSAIALRLSDAGAAVRLALPLSTARTVGRPTMPSWVLGTTSGPYTTYTYDDTYPETTKGDLAVHAPVDIAVIAPGWFDAKLFVDSTPDEWDAAFAHNFEQAVYAAQTVARPMVDSDGGGRIILLSSVAAMMPFIHLSAYGSSLAALRALAKMMAVELGPHGVTVNVVALGWIASEQTAPYLTDAGRAHVEAGIPLGRVGTPDDVAHLCTFLASDLAGYISGALIPVDGAYLMTQSDGDSAFPPGTVGDM